MARLALHPQVAGAIDVAPEYRMEEIEVGARLPGIGRTIGDVAAARSSSACATPTARFLPVPAAETTLDAGDVVMALGTPKTLERLEALFVTPRRAVAP